MHHLARPQRACVFITSVEERVLLLQANAPLSSSYHWQNPFLSHFLIQ